MLFGLLLSLSPVSSWAYVLQGQDGAPLPVEALASARVDVLVIDPESHGEPLTPAQVARLKQGGKRVLAYVSVGEAERYRAYWRKVWDKKAPPWLGPGNPDWPGNYKVRYWLPAWQKLMRQRLAGVVAAGFDGAYLDIIDGYEFWGPGGDKPERKSAAADMVDFVLALAADARKRRPGFLVVPQNGALILEDAPEAKAAAYLAAVDGIGAEDTFFYGDAEMDNPWRPQLDVLAQLARFRAAGKPVLAVDYLSKPESARRFVAAAREKGFVPYVGVRALDRLVVQP